jgi:hypothetical protein
MSSAGLQPQPEGEAQTPQASMHVSPERLAEFDRLVASNGIDAVMAALERERLERAEVTA